MKRYVLGFFFSEDRQLVALIRKNRPAYQAGQFNGLGGHIEPTDASPTDAMRREFMEEAGVDIQSWQECFSFLYDQNALIIVYRAFGNVLSVRTVTDEQVEVHDVRELPDNLLASCRFLIPMVLEDRLLNGRIILCDIQNKESPCPSALL